MVQLILEAEGSKTSPATVSKVPGTSYSTSTSSSSSSSASSSSTSSKSITELRGPGNDDLFRSVGGFEDLSQPSMSLTSTKTVSCTKGIRRVVVHTNNGPVEKMEEVIEGGPECQVMTDVNKGGMSALFPTLSQTSPSSVHTGGAKGSILGNSKTGFGDPFHSVGIDLGMFVRDNVEDDLPDFNARSVKSRRVERKADYVGKGTETSDLE